MLDTVILGVLGRAGGLRARAWRWRRSACAPGRVAWITFAIGFLIGWLYIALGESGPASATWGKRAFHLQVLGADRLDRISFLRATGRLLGRYLSMLLFMIGYLMQPFNARKRALHDFLSGTVVVVERQYSRLLVALMIVLERRPAGRASAWPLWLPAYQHYVVQAKVSAALQPGHARHRRDPALSGRTGTRPGFAGRGGIRHAQRPRRRTAAGLRSRPPA